MILIFINRFFNHCYSYSFQQSCITLHYFIFLSPIPPSFSPLYYSSPPRPMQYSMHPFVFFALFVQVIFSNKIFPPKISHQNFPQKKHKRIFHQTFPTENLPSTRSKDFLRNTCFTQVAGWSGGRVSAKAKGFPVELEDVWNQCGNRIVNSGDLWKQLERVHRPTLLSQVSRAN